MIDDRSKEPITQGEAEKRWHFSTRSGLSKKDRLRFYDAEGELTAEWKTGKDGNPILVGKGLTATFTRSKAGLVIGTVTKV